MSTALTIPGQPGAIEAHVEVRTTEFGTPNPRLLIRVRADVHWRLMNALGHRAAAEVELALHAGGLQSLVETVHASDWWQGRHRRGSQTGVSIELVGDERRMAIDEESKRVVRVLEALAVEINASGRRQP